MTWKRFALTAEQCQPFLAHGAELPRDKSLVDRAPPWRPFMSWEAFKAHHADDACRRWGLIRGICTERAEQKARSFVLSDSATSQRLVLAVNASLALRRPLLLTGHPGSGKTSLAFVIAAWLGLGPVLEWPVSPGAQLADALSTYNALARLEDLQIPGNPQGPVEDYVRLGPVGTAFLPAPLPRVLLIDEIDKGDLNLANDLLHLFEDGKFSIPDLKRAERQTGSSKAGENAEPQERWVETWDESAQGVRVKAPIRGGQVLCHEFPLVVMTSNGERDFPPAFNRRCLRVNMPDASREPTLLKAIVEQHLKEDTGLTYSVDRALKMFKEEMEKQRVQNDVLATDQLLNLAFLMDGTGGDQASELLRQVLLQGLNSELDLDGDGKP
jgi:MoxR-like ATPase